LALGANLPVLPLDTLLCVAEAARASHARVLVLMDARMHQVYAAAYEWRNTQWQLVQAPQLRHPSEVDLPPDWQGHPFAVAGNAWFSADLHASLQHLQSPDILFLALWPQATALLRLAAMAWQRGEAVAADQALPLYLRDQVALTTAERLTLKAAVT
jgi:tRNA threonylcarbamoyladenosine biosynthesis protein TsaB